MKIALNSVTDVHISGGCQNLIIEASFVLIFRLELAAVEQDGVLRPEPATPLSGFIVK